MPSDSAQEVHFECFRDVQLLGADWWRRCVWEGDGENPPNVQQHSRNSNVSIHTPLQQLLENPVETVSILSWARTLHSRFLFVCCFFLSKMVIFNNNLIHCIYSGHSLTLSKLTRVTSDVIWCILHNFLKNIWACLLTKTCICTWTMRMKRSVTLSSASPCGVYCDKIFKTYKIRYYY